MAKKKNGTNGASKKRQKTAQKIIEAVKETKGLLTVAALRAGVGYRTIVRYANEYPSVIQAVSEAKEEMKDFTESKLYEAIEDGNLTAILFFLKTQAKDRHYIERIDAEQRIEHKGELNIKMLEIDDEIAKKVLDEIAKKEIDDAGTTSAET